MNKIDNKIIFSIICNKELFQYLNNSDKASLSSTCKYIYNTSSRLRLSRLNFNIADLASFTQIIDYNNRSQNEIAKNQFEYLDNLIKKYRNYLLKLSTFQNANYYILEYFSIQFNVLTQLCLKSIIIPRETFKKMVENLHMLRELYISDLILSYPKNDPLTKIRFSKYLNKLTWFNVVNFEAHVKDPYQLSMLKHHNRFNHFSIIDNSVNSISSLKFLDWQCDHQNGIPMLIEILINNSNLISLYLSSSSLNSRIISLISTKKSLSILSISHMCNVNLLSFLKFVKLQFIKEIDIHSIQPNFNTTCNKLIDSCPNLEILRYSPLPGLESHLFKIISNLGKLKVLYIYLQYINKYSKLLKTKFPSSNLEHIIILSSHPLTVDPNIFTRSKGLKSIKILFYPHQSQNFDANKAHYDSFSNWRVIYYPSSVYCWKIL
jgi:hypothetical protein